LYHRRRAVTVAAANAAWINNATAVDDVAPPSVSPVARLASHASLSSCTSFGFGKGFLMDF
jgi:hypothetical protein